jgi:SNF2 family DNA or RNA helicase
VEEQIESHTKGIAKHQAALGAEEVLRLYLCWFQRKPDHFNHLFINGLWGFASEIKKGSVQAVRTSIQKTDNKSLKDFCVFLERVFERHDAPIAVQDITEDRDAASDLDFDDDSDDEDIPPSQNTPHKTRRREIAESQNAKHMRARGRIHLKEHEDRTAAYLQHQSSERGDLTNIIINPGKKDDEAAIPINSYIAERIQPHQVDGVRFMWREVVAANNKEEEMQGCLLAHTMGLGKTLQA